METLLNELLRESRDRRLFLARNKRRFRSALLLSYVMKESFALRYEDSAAMLCLAEVAAAIADGLRQIDLLPSEALGDLRAEAYAHLGNAYRVRSHYNEARRAFERAFLELSPTSPPRLRARLYLLQASYFEAVHDFGAALAVLQSAGTILKSEAPAEMFPILAQSALVEGYLGRPVVAVRLLRDAEPLIRSRHEAFSYLSILSVNLLECGYPQEAEATLYEFRKLAPEPREPLVQLRILWTEARINAFTGAHLVADQVFCEVRDGFAERGLHYEAAMVGMDHAYSLASRGATQEATRLIRELRSVLSLVGFETEALAVEILDRAVRSGCGAAVVLGALRSLRSLPRAAVPFLPISLSRG